MTIGVVALFVGVVPLELLALVQAASTPMPSSTVVPATNLVPMNRGRTGLTPIVIPAETVSCRVNGAKSVYRPAGTGLQVTAAPSTTRPSSARSPVTETLLAAFDVYPDQLGPDPSGHWT